MHLLRNLYLSFVLSQSDFEQLKQETLRHLHANPALATLLKASSSEPKRFTQGGSLHHLFKDQTGGDSTSYLKQHSGGGGVLLSSENNSEFSIDEKDCKKNGGGLKSSY